MASALKVGRKAVKLKGRKAGETVEITRIVDRNFVLVKDKKGKEKKCNVLHLELLE
jgi:ribosomal protein L14E/L6E/L27E